MGGEEVEVEVEVEVKAAYFRSCDGKPAIDFSGVRSDGWRGWVGRNGI